MALLRFLIKTLTDLCLLSPGRLQGIQFHTSKVLDLVIMSLASLSNTLLPLQLSPMALKSSTSVNFLRWRQPGCLKQATSL